jgi:DNA-binding NarL/FixJ family response regulator
VTSKLLEEGGHCDPPPARVLVADDHEVMRRGIRAVVDGQPGWSVCGEATTGREAVALALQLRPDVIVMDLQMPELNGVEATRQIKKSAPETEILILTGMETEELVRQVFDAGARSYIVKTDGKEIFETALRCVAAHKSYFTTRVAETLFAKFIAGRKGDADAGNERLTIREREIIQLLAEGKSNKEVADALGISLKTAETHRASIMRKLKFESFSDLVRYAARNQIVSA